jgi:HPt (histidine-containing phosphotransfer) domain-containing protein
MTEPIIDRAAFDELKEMVGDDFISELIDSYFEDCPKLMTELRHALESGDAVAFRRAAHALHSTSASMGAIQFAALAHRLEALGKDDRLGQAPPLLQELDADYAQVVAALKEST